MASSLVLIFVIAKACDYLVTKAAAAYEHLVGL